MQVGSPEYPLQQHRPVWGVTKSVQKEYFMEFSRMTNFDFLRTLSAEEFAHIFVKLREDSAEESDWVEWMKLPCKKEEWEQILK